MSNEIKTFANQIPAGSIVLDAGAGDAPYKSFLQHTTYESADFEKVNKPYANSTYVCDLSVIPVANERFDAIVFSQVMEHLPRPAEVISELFRVLKPGGKLFYSGPLFYEEHEKPYDFYRYTQFGVQHLFTQGGFRIETIDWLEGYYSTVAYQMNRMSLYLPMRPTPDLMGYLLVPLFFLLRGQLAVLSLGFHWLEMRRKLTDRGYPKNYYAILRKPESLGSDSTQGPS